MLDCRVPANFRSKPKGSKYPNVRYLPKTLGPLPGIGTPQTLYIYIYMYIYIYTYTYTYTSIRIDKLIYTYMYVYYTCIYTHIWVLWTLNEASDLQDVVVGVAVDLDKRQIYFSTNGSLG